MSWDCMYNVGGKHVSLNSMQCNGYFGIGFNIDDFCTMTTEEIGTIQRWAYNIGKDIALSYQDDEYDDEYRERLSQYETLDIIREIDDGNIPERWENIAMDVLDERWRDESKSRKITRSSKKKLIEGYVYLLCADNGLYKIGKAKRLDSRVTDVSVKVPMRIELVHSFESNDYTWAEKELHDKYADKRDHGEWFRLTPEDVEEIKGIERMDFADVGKAPAEISPAT